MRSLRARLAALVLISASLSGCFLWTTSGEGDALEAQARAQDERITALETSQQTLRENIQAEITRSQTKLAELETVLEQATAVVTRNSADTGAQVQELARQLATAEGHLDELRQQLVQTESLVRQQRSEMDERVTQLARKAGIDMPVPASEIPADRNEHYASAYRAYQSADYSRARAIFREFVGRYATDENADNAQYWIGASYLAENRPATALGELRKVISEYPQGDALDETLLDMAESFWRLHACTDAKNTLDAMIRSQANSPLLERARARLREIQRAPRTQCTS